LTHTTNTTACIVSKASNLSTLGEVFSLSQEPALCYNERRKLKEETGPKGDIISNYDIRLVQPNEDSIPTAGLHTIEHLLAKLIRTRIDGMIDCSPFGCRTGFHMIMWGRHTSAEIAAVIKDSLKEIAETTSWEDVPGTTIESCGNYKDHSLFSAKEWAKLILEQGISDDAFERHVI